MASYRKRKAFILLPRGVPQRVWPLVVFVVHHLLTDLLARGCRNRRGARPAVDAGGVVAVAEAALTGAVVRTSLEPCAILPRGQREGSNQRADDPPADYCLLVAPEAKSTKCSRCSHKSADKCRLGDCDHAICAMCGSCSMAIPVSSYSRRPISTWWSRGNKTLAPRLYIPKKVKLSALL